MMKEQTVADHTFRVMAIAMELFDVIFDESYKRGDILEHILTHDIDEAETGDTPSNNKNGSIYTKDNIKKVNIVPLFISLADTIEAFIWLDRYGVRPTTVRRYLESKIQITQEVLAEKYVLSITKINMKVNSIITMGVNYD